MNDKTAIAEIAFQARINVDIHDGELFISQENPHGGDEDILQVAPENIDRLISALASARDYLNKAGK